MEVVKDGIARARVSSYMYMYQRMGCVMDYTFRLNVGGLKSKSFDVYLNEQIAKGIILQRKRYLTPHTDTLRSKGLLYRQTNLNPNMSQITTFLNELEDAELYRFCITDFVIQTVIKQGNKKLLSGTRESVLKSMQEIERGYSLVDLERISEQIMKLQERVGLHE